MNKKTVCVLLIIVMLLSMVSLTGCSGKPADEKPAEQKPAEGQKSEKLHAVIGTSGIAGSWYPTMAAIAGVAMKHAPHIKLTVQSSGGGAENVRLMKQGEYQMGMVESGVAAVAYKGEGAFKEMGPYPELRFVANLYPTIFQAVVHKESDIYSIKDLKGRSFAPGSAGSGDELDWMIVIGEYGLTKDELDWRPVSHTERSMAFKDRQLDGMGFITAVPAGSILEACAQNPVRVLPIDGEERDRLVEKHSYFAKWVIPAGAYNGQDTDVETMHSFGMIVADASVPDELIYEFAKWMHEDLEPIQAVHQMAPYITLESALDGRGEIPIHPGAEKYYREKGLIK